jgi:hypothetical protein
MKLLPCLRYCLQGSRGGGSTSSSRFKCSRYNIHHGVAFDTPVADIGAQDDVSSASTQSHGHWMLQLQPILLVGSSWQSDTTLMQLRSAVLIP